MYVKISFMKKNDRRFFVHDYKDGAKVVKINESCKYL
jgi:hypothetical protein